MEPLIFDITPPDRDLLPFELAGDVQPVLDGLWLVDKWLPKYGTGALYANPGGAKTFFAIDLAAHVACGRTWAGHHVEQGLVLYVVAEGQTGFRNRLVAMMDDGRLDRDAPFVFVPVPIDLQAVDGDTAKLIHTIEQVSARLEADPALVVIDTLSKTFGAGKENTDDMAVYVANCQRVASAFKCFTLIVHHRPKDVESRHLRGHGSLLGGIDTSILIEGSDVRTAEIMKQKDGEEGLRVRFRLDRVVLGTNKRGEEVSTCLVRIEDQASQREMDVIARAAADNETFLECLRERLRQRRAVSEKKSPSYAPTEFAKMAESKKIGKQRLEDAMERLFRLGKIERAELWKGADRKPVQGLRETAGNGAGDTMRATQETPAKEAGIQAGNAGETHTPTYGRAGAYWLAPETPSGWEADGDLDDPFGDGGAGKTQ